MDWRDQLRELTERLRIGEAFNRLRASIFKISPTSLSSSGNPRLQAIGRFGESTATFIKKKDGYFYGKLVTVVLSTYFVSDLTTLLVEEVLPEPPTRKQFRSVPQSGRNQSHSNVIFSRNLFNRDGLIPETSRQVPPSDGPAVKTILPFALLGTIILQDPSRSLATVTDKSNSKVYPVRVDDEIPGSARIVQVEARKVTFINLKNNRKEYVDLPENSKFASIVSRPSGAVSPVVQKDGTRYSIARGEIEKTMANINQVLTQALARPHTVDGELVGYKLSQIAKGSIYEKLGLKNNDVLKGFDGQKVTDPMAAWDKLSDLKNLNQVELNVIRGGKEMTLSYDIL